MTLLRRTRPLVAYPEVSPVKYYSAVAKYMIKIVEERRLAAIVQREDEVKLVRSVRYRSGIRRPILVVKPSQIVTMAKKGAVDIMFSVTKVKEEIPDVLVVDVKADKHVWIHEYNWYIFDLVVQIICNYLKFLGIENVMVCFDGMNGYKIITLLDLEEVKAYVPDRQRFNRYISKLVEYMKELAIRVTKHYRHIIRDLDLFSHMLISGNTTLKIGLCRVPLSLHWSTKLAALPLPMPVREFAVTYSLPSRVLERLPQYGEVIEQKWKPNKVHTMMETLRKCIEEDYETEHLYKAKAFVMSHISLES